MARYSRTLSIHPDLLAAWERVKQHAERSNMPLSQYVVRAAIAFADAGIANPSEHADKLRRQD